MGKSRWSTVLAVAIFGFFVVYQLYASLYNPISTEIVSTYSAVDGIPITGIIIRDEEYVETSQQGTLHFKVSDGERVAAGGVIAGVYSEENQSVLVTRIDSIKKEIADIEEIQQYNDSNAVDLDLLNSRIFSKINETIAVCSTGNFADVDTKKSELLSLINRKQIATGEAVDFSQQLTSLKKELSSLEKQMGKPISSITAKRSGYFISSTDGYEQVLKTDNLDKLTPEFLDSLTPNEDNGSTVVGKLVSDYTWYIAASLSLNDSVQFKQGDELVIRTQLQSNPELHVTVKQVNISPAQDRAVVLFSCQEMSSELSSMRTGSMTVVKNIYNGLKVNSKALRFVNRTVTDENGEQKTVNQTGVYVLSGMTAKFVPVEIIYNSSDFVVCKINNEDGALRLYDEIIVKGKNMYDGKLID